MYKNYGLDNRGIVDRFPAEEEIFLSLYGPDQLWAIQLSTQWVPGALYPGVEQTKSEGNHSPSSPKVKNPLTSLNRDTDLTDLLVSLQKH
jgi:hypothetical protein